MSSSPPILPSSPNSMQQSSSSMNLTPQATQISGTQASMRQEVQSNEKGLQEEFKDETTAISSAEEADKKNTSSGKSSKRGSITSAPQKKKRKRNTSKKEVNNLKQNAITMLENSSNEVEPQHTMTSSGAVFGHFTINTGITPVNDNIKVEYKQQRYGGLHSSQHQVSQHQQSKSSPFSASPSPSPSTHQHHQHSLAQNQCSTSPFTPQSDLNEMQESATEITSNDLSSGETITSQQQSENVDKSFPIFHWQAYKKRSSPKRSRKSSIKSSNSKQVPTMKQQQLPETSQKRPIYSPQTSIIPQSPPPSHIPSPKTVNTQNSHILQQTYVPNVTSTTGAATPIASESSALPSKQNFAQSTRPNSSRIMDTSQTLSAGSMAYHHSPFYQYNSQQSNGIHRDLKNITINHHVNNSNHKNFSDNNQSNNNNDTNNGMGGFGIDHSRNFTGSNATSVVGSHQNCNQATSPHHANKFPQNDHITGQNYQQHQHQQQQHFHTTSNLQNIKGFSHENLDLIGILGVQGGMLELKQECLECLTKEREIDKLKAEYGRLKNEMLAVHFEASRWRNQYNDLISNLYQLHQQSVPQQQLAVPSSPSHTELKKQT